MRRRARPNFLVDARGDLLDEPADARLVAFVQREPNLRADLRAAERELMLFHSRPLREVVRLPDELHTLLPQVVVPIGAGIHVKYQNDKDDPHTRAPGKRAGDPDGVVGVVKDFIHKHDGFVLPTVYGSGSVATRYGNGGRSVAMVWPQATQWLGVYLGSKIDVGFGRGTLELRPKGWDLWALPGGTTLFACSGEALADTILHGRPLQDVIVIRGGSLHVGWRGIGG